jgi:DNA polymerase-3 subunit gamma/tau
MSITPCGTCYNCEAITIGDSLDVKEIDGASNTGVDDVRELQKELLYAASQSRYKIIIIDEVHMLSKNAFNALLKTLEEPPDKVIFIFATTEPHKVLPTIISRCQRFDFKKIPVELIVKRLRYISDIEGIKVDEEALYIIARKADGGMRDALSLMDQVISFGLENITTQQVEEIFGIVGQEVFNDFMNSILNQNPTELLSKMQAVTDKGIDIQEFINDYLEYLRQFIFIKLKLTPDGISDNLLKSIEELASKFTEDEILYIINFLIETKNNLRISSAPMILSELAFIKIGKIAEMKSLKTILETMTSGKVGTQPPFQDRSSGTIIAPKPVNAPPTTPITSPPPQPSNEISPKPIESPSPKKEEPIVAPQPENNSQLTLDDVRKDNPELAKFIETLGCEITRKN